MVPDLGMHLEKLRTFYEIANEGSLQATGRKLGVSAATLSYTLKELEAVTRVTLFDRTSKGVTLTRAGERLYNYCKRLYIDLAEVEEQLWNLDFGQKRRVRIGTFSSIAIYFWPELLNELQTAPTISTSIMTRRSKEVLEALIRHEIDIAITVGGFDISQLTGHELYSDKYSFYGRPPMDDRALRRSELSNEVLLYIPDAEDENNKTMLSHVHDLGLHFKTSLEFDSFEVILDFVKRGYGIGLIPHKVARNSCPAIAKLRIDGVPSEGFGTHRFFMSYRKNLDLPQNQINLILSAARKAVISLEDFIDEESFTHPTS